LNKSNGLRIDSMTQNQLKDQINKIDAQSIEDFPVSNMTKIRDQIKSRSSLSR